MAGKRTYTFYRELNNLSTFNFLKDQKRQKSSQKRPYYAVERVITKRNRKGMVSWFDLFVLTVAVNSRLFRLKSILFTP